MASHTLAVSHFTWGMSVSPVLGQLPCSLCWNPVVPSRASGSLQQHPEAGSGDTKPLQTKAATWPSQVGLSLQKSVSPSLPFLGGCMLVWTSTSVPDVANRAHSLCTRAHYLGLTCGSGLALNAQKGCMTGWCSDHTHRDHQGRLFRPRGQDAWQSQCLGQALLHTAQSALVWKALEHLSLFNHWFL